MTERLLSILAIAVALALPITASAQAPRSIDQILAETSEGAAREGEPGLVTAARDEVICRNMTDLAQRTRRERVCMSRHRWDALIASTRRRTTPTVQFSLLGASARAR